VLVKLPEAEVTPDSRKKKAGKIKPSLSPVLDG